ncbi:MAG: hypothetical protein IJE46_01950 [Clostridia bacterium]|nr:hypothetical protein [Clostridia bacterium]
MKKIAVLMCLMLVLCTACGEKENKDNQPPQQQDTNRVQEVAQDISENITKDPMSVEKSDIDKAKESALQMEKELKDQVGKVKDEDVEQFQNRQVSVELLKQGLDALEKAKADGDQEAIIKAQTQIEMAKSLWDFVQEE